MLCFSCPQSGLWASAPNLLTNLLLESIHYQKKGLMLDTGHFLHTNHKLRTQEEALLSLNQMLDEHEAYFHSARTGADGEDFLAWIHGIHLQQSLTGAYVEDWITHPIYCQTIPWNR